MSKPTSKGKLDLRHVTEQRDEFKTLLEDAYEIINASGDPDCKVWLGQARAALAKAAVMP